MLFSSNRKVQVVASVLFAIGVIFAPGPSSYETGERFLSEVQQGTTTPASESRKLATLTCGAGEVAVIPDWSSVTIDPTKDVQIVEVDAAGTTENKKATIRLTTSKTGNTSRSAISLRNGNLDFNANTVPAVEDVIVPPTSHFDDVARPSDFPSSFATLEFEFLDINVTRLQFTTIFAGSWSDKTPAVRMRCFDDNDNEITQYEYSGSQMEVVGNFAYDKYPLYLSAMVKWASMATLPGAYSTPCRRLRVDLSSFTFTSSNVGKTQSMMGIPGGISSIGDRFRYCTPTAPPAEPSPAPTEHSIPPAPTDAGIQGDPLIMGLAGQLFKFDGTSGGWFSAVSAKSFQWNMRIHEFSDCPADSNTFTTGASFQFFDSAKKAVRNILITVVDETKFNVGCAASGPACLGAGSIELEIDGEKITAPGVYGFNDTSSSSDQVVAFNTFHQCSRKWYDFDIVPVDVPADNKPDTKSARRHVRRLDSPKFQPYDVFQTIRRIKKTMIDPVVCEEWLEERQRFQDLFKQEGHYSTILIKMEDVSFHIEYKQESERCNAHSIDVWMSSVRPEIFEEEWEGVIGETKQPTKGDKYNRNEVLKFDKDEDYKVPSPFSVDCKGCFRKK